MTRLTTFLMTKKRSLMFAADIFQTAVLQSDRSAGRIEGTVSRTVVVTGWWGYREIGKPL